MKAPWMAKYAMVGTARDFVRTSVRQGARSVRCLFRRDRANMPGSQREVANAEEEGVEFVWVTAPKGFTDDAVTEGIVQEDAARRFGRDGSAGAGTGHGIGLRRMRRSRHQGAGLRAREPAGTFGGKTRWNRRDWGTIKARFQTHETSMNGVYAVGDIVRGASLVVWAIRDGREAADAILERFGRQAIAARRAR